MFDIDTDSKNTADATVGSGDCYRETVKVKMTRLLREASAIVHQTPTCQPQQLSISLHPVTQYK